MPDLDQGPSRGAWRPDDPGHGQNCRVINADLANQSGRPSCFPGRELMTADLITGRLRLDRDYRCVKLAVTGDDTRQPPVPARELTRAASVPGPETT